MKSVLQSMAMALPALMLAGALQAGTLENMERERAQLIKTLIADEMTLEERQQQVQSSQRRLLDLERMVLRDDSLTGQNTPKVRTTFANYDLSFLVHASTEKDRLLLDHWLTQLRLTTRTLMNSRVGRR